MSRLYLDRLAGPRSNGYRRDCSGYVSMALGLVGPGLDTAGLAARSRPIQTNDLRAGDLLINPGSGSAGQVVIFDRWTRRDDDQLHRV